MGVEPAHNGCRAQYVHREKGFHLIDDSGKVCSMRSAEAGSAEVCLEGEGGCFFQNLAVIPCEAQ